jgi:4-hydroxyphenylacetaldehyde oxime monooxygenase
MFLRLGMTPALAVSSAAAARDVLRAHDPECCNRPASPGSKLLSYEFSTMSFSPYGDYWRDMRRLFAAELLGARRVRAAWASRREQVQKLVDVLGNAAARSVPLEMDEHVYRVADGTIGTVAFGSVSGAATFAARYERFQHVLDEAMDVLAGFAAEDFFPNAAGRLADRLAGTVARRERVIKDLDAFFEAVIEQRMDPRPEEDEDGGGLVDTLVGLWKQGGQGFTKDNVKAILLDAFLGGIDTSSATILWAMSELVRQPLVMAKAQAEIRAAVAAVDGDRDNGDLILSVQPEDLPKLRYLRMVVKETLRLHPPATLLLPRETTELVEIGGYEVPAGTRVLVNAWAIGRDPASWGSDAEEFVPERFEGSEVDFRGAHFDLLPFGAGRRVCPGLAMGVANVEFTLANILGGFDWTLPDGVKKVSMEEAGGLTIHRKTPLVLVPTVYRPV